MDGALAPLLPLIRIVSLGWCRLPLLLHLHLLLHLLLLDGLRVVLVPRVAEPRHVEPVGLAEAFFTVLARRAGALVPSERPGRMPLVVEMLLVLLRSGMV